MKIIRADESHIDHLVDLFDAYRVWYGKLGDKPAARAFLLDRIQNEESIIFVCADMEAGAALVGFTQLYPIFSSTRMKRMWLLNDLFVSPAHRGKGVSRELIGAAKSLCKETNGCGVLLETGKSNTIGNKLYPSEGFDLESNNFYFWTNS